MTATKGRNPPKDFFQNGLGQPELIERKFNVDESTDAGPFAVGSRRTKGQGFSRGRGWKGRQPRGHGTADLALFCWWRERLWH
jgi:hypothetical protein